ncbi:MAG: SDR family oxidoreductase [Dehalococcoidales bacterium]|nr:MAG: SDR family oxidoreductase [Dehalococcoidales bacterium]
MQELIPLSKLISLDGKTAVITGGARGIGLAITRRLAEAGAVVVIVDTDTAEAENAVSQLKSQDVDARYVKCDVTVEAEVKKMINYLTEKAGRIDILVNNAGIYPRKSLEEMTGEDFQRVISVNLTGTFLCSRYTAEEMISRGKGGCIINIASIEALHPSSSGMSAYDASKGGVFMLTKSMASELGKHDIRVNAIAPGAIKTRGMLSQTSPSRDRSQLKELKSFLSRISLGRLGDADDIARAALFLASDMAEYITGEMIVVDGGYLVS